MFDKFDGLGHRGGDQVGVCPGLGGELGLLVRSEGLEGVDLLVDLHHGAQHPLTGVRYELLTHGLQSSVNVLLGVQQMFLRSKVRTLRLLSSCDIRAYLDTRGGM